MENGLLQRKMVVFRAKHNITQKELAQMCSLTEQTINAVERGTNKPSRITVQKILNVIEKGEEKND